MELGIKGKIAMVTGAGSGIGAAISKGLISEGAETIMVDINEKALNKISTEFGPRAIPKICDVTDKKSMDSLFREIGLEFGKLHILVNCAAISIGGYVEEIKESEIEKILALNVKGYIYTTIGAIPFMKNQRFGRIIYINSSSGLKASAGLSLYSGSKYFNRGFAIATALELGKYNITVNSVCPSDVYPESYLTSIPEEADETKTFVEPKSWFSESLLKISFEKEGVKNIEELVRKRIEKNPMKRSCRVQDVVDLVLFLASERAGFINAQSIGLNGGAIPY